MARRTFKEKRTLTLVAFSLRMFFMGVEYAVIFPSLWLYLKIFHVEYWYLGLVLSAYNMVGIISTILVGRLVDATRKVRFTGFLWNLAEISGNFIYSMPFWVGLPLIGRMIAGFGEGFISAMWGELARVTTREQRTRYFAILKGSNLLGAAVGPAFNLFLKPINFKIGPWPINFRTSPGFIMGLTWIVMTIFMLFTVSDLSWELRNNPDYQLLLEEPASKLKRKKKKPKHSLTTSKSPEKSPRPIDKEPQSTEKSPLAPREGVIPTSIPRSQKPLPDEDEKVENLPNETDTPHKNKGNPFESFDSTGSESEAEEALNIGETDNVTFRDALLDMFTKFHVIVLVYLLFFMYIIHTSLQGIAPLIAENMLLWNETQVSLLYTGWGLEIILVVVVIWLIAPKVSDRAILVCAVICGCCASAFFIVMSYAKRGSNLCLYSFIMTILLSGIGISVTVVTGRSLVSKHTKPENQGLVHAILTGFNRLAGLTGPIFGSSLYTRMVILGWILLTVKVIGLILVSIAYKKLKVEKTKKEVKN
ncbi:major facilitator superfamily domain-containing 8-like [Paramuricea clavata]|uniref:Major facilitator superfamily domain-containing 8-like n=1 Tax=Paramuricea clavata TaxID=317549 RepID=A0A7D9E1D3_PARCT|nr:major facilitator superfamily domain-containing 8-like [Paramuricea clavata]